MLAPNFPAWLPTAVANEARRILEYAKDPAGAALVIRLATDIRMKRVWVELSKLKFDRPHLDKLKLVLKLGGPLLDDRLTDQEAALTLFFRWACVRARAPIALITISELDALLASCESIARELRKSAADVRALPGRLSGSEMLGIRDIEHGDAEYHAKNIERAAKFYEGAITKIIQLKAVEGLDPRVVDRPGKYRPARSYVRHLATNISKPLYGTLATIASVALDHPISKEQVIEWTRGVKGFQNKA